MGSSYAVMLSSVIVWVASRLLEIIPRSQICLAKRVQIGKCLGHYPEKHKLTDSPLGSFSTMPLHEWPAKFPVMHPFGGTGYLMGTNLSRQGNYLFLWSSTDVLSSSERFHEHQELFPFRLVVCSLGFLWEDELRGLSQLAWRILGNRCQR